MGAFVSPYGARDDTRGLRAVNGVSGAAARPLEMEPASLGVCADADPNLPRKDF